MAVTDLSQATQDYLKCVWTLQEWSEGAVSMTALAERLGVRTSTASDGIKKLVEQGLVEHIAYGGITLTHAGRAHAIAMVRRHRLLETYLVSALGYGWDEVHDEAEVLEHAVSDRMLDAIDTLLGHPTRDPHGDPIPSAGGDAHLPDAVTLAQAAPGMATVVRVSDADPERLRRFAQAGIVPDVPVEVAHAGEARVGETTIALKSDDAAAVWVTTAQQR
ncbi:metal-dependent transcriptional regulator [Demequina lutea]|uniref:Manganese transport regulator n=1 Tax=Demequina lutea TaxID=431489 RepID=A0A7Y9ZBQ7_9MICO|nr:metal-dependent transcriptional regulator [Demequina lutea]NYI41658.1 DtxR family Mn-dependent transcriptional regulator [Demequina lutea]